MDYSKELKKESEKHSKAERKKLIIDFDEAIEEQKAEAIVVKFQGEEFNLPPNAPAWLPLFINRHSGDDGVVSDKHNLELVEKLLGKEFADKILESSNFISFELVNTKILQPVMDQWGLQFRDESKNGIAPSS